MDPSGWIGDKGYVGRGMITPHKKPPNGELSEAAKEENRSVNRIRQVVERTIAHIKSWRILHTPYRRPLETFEQTITSALALYAFKTTPRITFLGSGGHEISGGSTAPDWSAQRVATHVR